LIGKFPCCIGCTCHVVRPSAEGTRRVRVSDYYDSRAPIYKPKTSRCRPARGTPKTRSAGSKIPRQLRQLVSDLAGYASTERDNSRIRRNTVKWEFRCVIADTPLGNTHHFVGISLYSFDGLAVLVG